MFLQALQPHVDMELKAMGHALTPMLAAASMGGVDMVMNTVDARVDSTVISLILRVNMSAPPGYYFEPRHKLKFICVSTIDAVCFKCEL